MRYDCSWCSGGGVDVLVLVESGGGFLLVYGSTANVTAFVRTDNRIGIFMDATDVPMR
jgi:hypothetical protein